jgi:hypothetical protein
MEQWMERLRSLAGATAAGSDMLVGGPGRDWLWGKAGNNRFSARDRNRDSILGG